MPELLWIIGGVILQDVTYKFLVKLYNVYWAPGGTEGETTEPELEMKEVDSVDDSVKLVEREGTIEDVERNSKESS